MAPNLLGAIFLCTRCKSSIRKTAYNRIDGMMKKKIELPIYIYKEK